MSLNVEFAQNQVEELRLQTHRSISFIGPFCLYFRLFFWRGNLYKKGKNISAEGSMKWIEIRIIVAPSSSIPEDDCSKGTQELHALKKSNPVCVGSSFPWSNPKIWSQIHPSYPKRSTPLMIHLNSTLFPIPSKSFASTKHEQYVTFSLPFS